MRTSSSGRRRRLRSRTIAALALVVVVTAGCSDDDADRRAVAAAKCSLPSLERVGLAEDPGARAFAHDVEDLGDGKYRVTGEVATGDERDAVPYVCEVAPDSTDTLRGLRVTRLAVGSDAQ